MEESTRFLGNLGHVWVVQPLITPRAISPGLT